MRKVVLSLIVVASIAVAAVPVLAQAPGPGTWNVGFTMQNLSATEAATVHIDFVQSNGSSGGTWDGSISADGSQFLYSGNLSIESETAATISSNTELAVVANLASSAPKTEAAYSGIGASEVASQLFVPGVYKSYYYNTSNIRVQNAGSSETCVRVTYYALGSTSAADTDFANVPSGAGHTFTQADNAALLAPFIGSAVIESKGSGTSGCGSGTTAGQSLAAIVNIVIPAGPNTGNPSSVDLFGSYNAVTGGDSAAYVPVLANNYYNNRYISALTVLNLQGSAQWVRVSYGDGSTSEKQLAANASQLWYTPNEGPAVGWFGSGKVECLTGSGGAVTTSCEIVATVNQIDNAGGFASFNGFTDGSNSVRLPIVNRRYATAYGGYTTSVTCQNISSVTTDVSLALTGGNSVPNATNIGENGKAFWYLNGAAYTNVATGWNGSATATALNASADIVCIGQQNGETPPEAGDWLTTYNGINQ